MAISISFNNGGTLWFTLLSIYTALCSLCLYHVQSSMATISWINRSIDLIAGHSNVVVVTMPLVSHEDGGFFALGWFWFCFYVDNMIPREEIVVVTMVRLLWDPGGVHLFKRFALTPVNVSRMASLYPMASLHRSHRSMDVDLIAGHTNVNVTMVRRLIWDPGIASWAIIGTMVMPVYFEVFQRWQCRGVLIQSLFQHSHPILSRLRWSGLWSLIPLLFHCFHPVLSRPTVPNIHA